MTQVLQASTTSALPVGRTQAMVLGASGGIGHAYCDALAARGFDLFISGRNTETLDELATQLRFKYKIDVLCIAGDLCNADDRARIGQVIECNDRLKWFVNSAGLAQWGRFVELPSHEEQAMHQVNFVGAVELIRYAMNSFRERGGGTIIHVSSAAAFYSVPYLAGYSASKAAMVNFLSAVIHEVRGQNLCIQALCPGFVKTEMFARAGADAELLPRSIWMSAESVVKASLRASARGSGICIPGVFYRALLIASRFAPSFVSQRIAGWLFSDFSKYRLSSG